MKAALWALRCAVALVFGYAAVAKIADPAAFLTAIQTFHLLSDAAALALAVWLPWAELTAALALFWPRHRRTALVLLLLFTVVFLAALTAAWLRGLDIDCGCFGRPALTSGRGYWIPVGRDLALLAAIGWQLWRERKR